MPWRGPRRCHMQQCAEPALTGSVFCSRHRVKNPSRSTLTSSGSTWAWRKTRKLYLTEHPLCEWEECQQAATAVDHVIPRASAGDDHPSNLIAYCAPHHRQSHKLPRSYGRAPEDLGGFA